MVQVSPAMELRCLGATLNDFTVKVSDLIAVVGSQYYPCVSDGTSGSEGAVRVGANTCGISRLNVGFRLT